jgi:hypothetical protein
VHCPKCRSTAVKERPERTAQDRIKAAKSGEEVRQRAIEAEVGRAQAEAAGRSFKDRVRIPVIVNTQSTRS